MVVNQGGGGGGDSSGGSELLKGRGSGFESDETRTLETPLNTANAQ